MIITENGVASSLQPNNIDYIPCLGCQGNFLTCECEFPENFIEIINNHMEPKKEREMARKPSTLEFSYQGQQLEIEFNYNKLFVNKPGDKTLSPSDQLYTTVRILEVRPGSPREAWQLYGGFSASVGCASGTVRDQFCYETGRKEALKKLTRVLPKELRGIVWRTYLTRRDREPQPKKRVIVGLIPQVKAPEELVKAVA